jgi:hypothetical protein
MPVGRHRPRFGVVSRQQLPRQSDRREPLHGGNAAEEVQPKPTRPGTRSWQEGGSRASSSNTGASGGKPKEVSAYPTDRILGGEEQGRWTPGTGMRTFGEALLNAPRRPVATPGAREVGCGAELGIARSWVETPRTRAGSRRQRRDFAGLALTVHGYRGGRWTPSTRLSALLGSRSRGPCAGHPVLRYVRMPACLVLGRSVGFRTSSSLGDVERVQPESVATSARVPQEPVVPADILRGMARIAGQTLDARRKGMRGQLRWFTPSRLAYGLKTAKIGKGHGGRTQPIRVLGS